MADVARSRLPKQIALVTVDETHALPSLMANDFEDALGAYSRIGGTRPPAVLHSLEGEPTSKASASSMPWRLMTPKMPKMR